MAWAIWGLTATQACVSTEHSASLQSGLRAYLSAFHDSRVGAICKLSGVCPKS